MLTVEPSGTVRHRAIGTVSGTVTGGSGVTRNHCAIQYDGTRTSSTRLRWRERLHFASSARTRHIQYNLTLIAGRPLIFIFKHAWNSRARLTGRPDRRRGAGVRCAVSPAKLSVFTGSRQSRSTTHDCFMFVHHITSHAYPQLTSLLSCLQLPRRSLSCNCSADLAAIVTKPSPCDVQVVCEDTEFNFKFLPMAV